MTCCHIHASEHVDVCVRVCVCVCVCVRVRVRVRVRVYTTPLPCVYDMCMTTTCASHVVGCTQHQSGEAACRA